MMKLLRYGKLGLEKPGILDAEGKIRDLSEIIPDITRETLSAASLNKLRTIDLSKLPIVDKIERIGTPLREPGKIICMGLNYFGHVKECGREVPEVPFMAVKFASSLCGPNDDIVLPKDSSTAGWEVELAVVIGKKGRYIKEVEAMEYVAGYTIIDDISERSFMILEGGAVLDLTRSKNSDTFGPLGPYLVTKDEIPNPQNLPLWLEINGHRYQDSNTKDMIKDIPYIISFFSNYFTLDVGDVIATGTPGGTDVGQDPKSYLKPGDLVRCGIEGLGEQCQKVRKWS